MKPSTAARIVRPLVALAALAAAFPAPAAETVATRFVLLAGHPAADGGGSEQGALVVPGLVMALGDATPELSRLLAGAEEIATLARKLEATLGLDRVEVLYSTLQTVELHRPMTLTAPTPTSPVRVHVALEGFNPQAATYRVRFTDARPTAFADSVLTVPREKRALVGGLDGPEAPYLFLVVEPQGVTRRVDENITPPQVLERPAPQYTEEGRAARVQGVVILQLEIDRHGEVRKTTVLKGLPAGLSEAAAEAVRTWRFEPARDESGKAIDVFYNITVHFRLDDEEATRESPPPAP